ncbi:hypothetical protein B0F90DRAFT_1669871 [Multifurca ochricompacta]|uniref:Uncharacterized protein n=1 Tax=Multifurca ochricompacta TaxID=376703 RepID=A0AAD4M1G4_9AGAM|nr:hypothetical protein B0F90DRAFT_1669871 [Multifurca ochricompacta]
MLWTFAVIPDSNPYTCYPSLESGLCQNNFVYKLQGGDDSRATLNSTPTNNLPMDSLSSLRPMKNVERADRLMREAKILYEKYGLMMRPDDRVLVEDRMTIAGDYRHGVEEKSLWAQAEQARLYLNFAQEALKTVQRAVGVVVEISR